MATGRPIIHGHHRRLTGRSKEWCAWDHMKQRCYNANNCSYKHYGAKGITVCKRWRNSFVMFFKDMGHSPSPQHSLDRFPNKKGNYKPGNCRWATNIEQQRNRTDNRLIEAFGEIKTLSEWAENKGIGISTICTRLKLGWTNENALSLPVRKKSVQKNNL